MYLPHQPGCATAHSTAVTVPELQEPERTMLEDARFCCSLRMPAAAATYVRRHLDIWGAVLYWMCEDCEGHGRLTKKSPYYELLLFLARHDVITKQVCNRLKKIYACCSEYVHGQRHDVDAMRCMVEEVERLAFDPFKQAWNEEGDQQ